jgi:hypothetical protein
VALDRELEREQIFGREVEPGELGHPIEALTQRVGVDEQRPGGGGDARAGAGEAEDAREQLATRHRALLTMSAGAAIETAKRVGDPERLIEGIGLRGLAGSHALGHTRMATESMITTEHSHPFSTGADLCLVHNGSLSNHNRLRGSAGSPTSPTATETRCSSTPGASNRCAPRAEPEPASPPSLS